MATAWQTQIHQGVRGLDVLAGRGFLDKAQVQKLTAVVERYGFFTTESFLNLADPEDPSCPIRAQITPAFDELVSVPGESRDPIGDHTHSKSAGVVHRYADRALVFLTHQCPILCRFCFRKVYLNEESPVPFSRRLEEAVAYIRTQSELREIILSGGDPLLLNDRRLRSALEELGKIPHITSVRLHTRVLTTLPSRITEELLEILSNVPNLTLVAHVNHSKELGTHAKNAFLRIRKTGARLLSQSVLLKGVNNHPSTLRDLFIHLANVGVTPYYLHHPDTTVGTQHLRVSLEEGIDIYRKLRGTMPGFTIPTYVIDIPDGGGKVPVDSSFVRKGSAPGTWTLESPLGGTSLYRDPAHTQPSSALGTGDPKRADPKGVGPEPLPTSDRIHG